MLTRMKCSQGHTWEPAETSASPLVCPTCGRAPDVGAGGGGAAAIDPDATVAQGTDEPLDADRTVDLPTPAANAGGSLPSRDEVTQTMHFTPAAPPSRTSSSTPAARSSADRGSPAPAGAGMPFVIVRQHARGGLGVVNLARDVHIKREVAFKQILPQHADNSTLRMRFLYEAQITGQLEHPSIVPVYCLGSDDKGYPYYVMRFVKGRTLDEIIKEHHVSPNPIVFRELLRRFIAVCQAVAYAHSRGVIHRDLKPSNVMLGDYGETLVLDWGLAKDIKNAADPAFFAEANDSAAGVVEGPRSNRAVDKGFDGGGGAGMSGTMPGMGGGPSSAGQSRVTRNAAGTIGGVAGTELTMQGQIIGTPAYMAPEQAEGRTELHAPVTDIYALGGILYKILAGQSPTAPNASTTGTSGQRKLTFVESPPPSKVNKDVEPGLEQICRRAMATDPAARYPRALELAQDIQRWLDEHPLIMRPRTALGRFKAVVAAHSGLIIVGLVLVIVLLVVLMLLHLG